VNQGGMTEHRQRDRPDDTHDQFQHFRLLSKLFTP